METAQKRVLGQWSHLKAHLPEAVSAWSHPLDTARSLLVDANRSLSRLHGIKATLELAQPYLHVADDRWDRDPLVLGVRNGIVDLATGELRPADPEAYITRCAGTEYDLTASCPTWLQFLGRVQPIGEDREALQVLAGYTCTGLTAEQAACFHFGAGANGKSTFFRALSSVLGTYAVTAGPALVDRKSDHREQAYETARLPGARMVTISETENSTDLTMAVVKRLTGGEEVSARHMYGKSFAFEPICKLHLSTNHLPQVRDNSHGAWRRLRTIPWQETITEEEKDPKLAQKLAAELPGILNWILKGAQIYLRVGLVETASTKALNREMRENLQRRPAMVSDGNLGEPWERFVVVRDVCNWATRNGFAPQTVKSWVEELRSQGCTKIKNAKGNIVWTGIRLQDSEERLPNPASTTHSQRAEHCDRELTVLAGGSRRL